MVKEITSNYGENKLRNFKSFTKVYLTCCYIISWSDLGGSVSVGEAVWPDNWIKFCLTLGKSSQKCQNISITA